VSSTLEGIKGAWIEQAHKQLGHKAPKYVEGIRSRVTKSSGEFSAEVYLQGDTAKKIELGSGPYDMKPGFAKSGKVKIGEENQWYLHVPFRHTTPAATGKMGRPMPGSVYRKVAQTPQWGRLQTSGKPSVSPSGYTHQTDIYNGMTKVPESPTSSRNAYMTWRTVGENSSPSSWVHPGFEGANILENLSNEIEDTFFKVLYGNVKRLT